MSALDFTIRIKYHNPSCHPSSVDTGGETPCQARSRSIATRESKASNGEVILASEGYKTKRSCLIGIESVCKNAILDSRFERHAAKNGRPRFVLKAGNHQIIGTSELYNSAKARDDGIKSVGKHAPAAKLTDLTSR